MAPCKHSKRERRLALVVGVNETPRSRLLAPLKYAESDASVMAEVLTECCGFELIVPPLLGEQATSEAVRTAVYDLCCKGGEDDFLLLYFAGHGQPLSLEAERHAIYLGTASFNEAHIGIDEHAHLSLHWLRVVLYEKTRAGRVLLLLDCCFSGEMGRTAPDHYLGELRQRLKYYFEVPGAEGQTRSGGLRLALTATGHGVPAREEEGSGLLTRHVVSALRGEVPQAINSSGYVSIHSLYEYLQEALSSTFAPNLPGDPAGCLCNLAEYPQLRQQRGRSGAAYPLSYIPHPRDPLFQERLGEFEHLTELLCGQDGQAGQVGLVGVTGMGGIGKTRLAVELAYRLQERFPAGIFWTVATGTTRGDWITHFAALALNANYLPEGDDPSHADNEQRRAQHLCRYLAGRSDALLILDNVDEPSLLWTVLPSLAGGELRCALLSTSRQQQVPEGMAVHVVDRLPDAIALRLLLLKTRPEVLAEIEEGKLSQESQAAWDIIRLVEGLPLALIHLRGLLKRDETLTLLRVQSKLQAGGVATLSEVLEQTFSLSWGQVKSEEARRVFVLASGFPEAQAIPCWMLGLAAGLGEEDDLLTPLGEVLCVLQERSLVEWLMGQSIRLHSLVRAFGAKRLEEEERRRAVQRIEAAWRNLDWVEQHIQMHGYWQSLEHIRVMCVYGEGLQGEQRFLRQVERSLDRESYLLAGQWAQQVQGLVGQQLWNWSVEREPGLFVGRARGVELREAVGRADESLVRVLSGHSRSVNSVALSADNGYIVSGGNDGTVRVWEVGSGQEMQRLSGDGGPVSSVTLSCDSRYIVSGSDDQTVRVWDLNSGQVVQLFSGHSGPVRSVSLFADNRYLMSGGDNGDIRVWDLYSGQIVHRISENTFGVRSVALSADSRYVVIGGFGEVRVWGLSSGQEVQLLRGHTAWVRSVALSADSGYIVSGSNDGTVRVWELCSGQEVQRLSGHSGPVRSVAISADSRYIVSGGDNGDIWVWELRSGQEVQRLSGYSGSVRSVAISADSRYIVSGGSDQMVWVWELSSWREAQLLSEHTVGVNSVVFSADSRYIVGGGFSEVRVWELSSGQVAQLLRGHTAWVRSVAISADSGYIVSGGDDQTVRVWKLSSGQEVQRLSGHSGPVRSVGISADSRYIVSGGGDGEIRVWDLHSGQEVQRLSGHRGFVNTVALTGDNKYIISGGGDGEIRVWDLHSGQEVQRLSGHRGFVNTVALSADSNFIVTCDSQGYVLFWQRQQEEEWVLAGLYFASEVVDAVRWESATDLLLVDRGAGHGRPYVHRIRLHGLDRVVGERDEGVGT